MNIDLSNPPYAVKLNELGFAYSYTDREKGVIVYTHAEPRLVGSPWINCWDDMECIIDFEDANCMKPSSFTFKHALDVLKDDYPLVTVPEESLTQYKPFFRKFKFQLKDSYDGYYRLGKKEYAFNGFL